MRILFYFSKISSIGSYQDDSFIMFKIFLIINQIGSNIQTNNQIVSKKQNRYFKIYIKQDINQDLI